MPCLWACHSFASPLICSINGWVCTLRYMLALVQTVQVVIRPRCVSSVGWRKRTICWFACSFFCMTPVLAISANQVCSLNDQTSKTRTLLLRYSKRIHVLRPISSSKRCQVIAGAWCNGSLQRGVKNKMFFVNFSLITTAPGCVAHALFAFSLQICPFFFKRKIMSSLFPRTLLEFGQICYFFGEVRTGLKRK